MRDQIERAYQQGQIGPAAFDEWMASMSGARQAWAEVLGVGPSGSR